MYKTSGRATNLQAYGQRAFKTGYMGFLSELLIINTLLKAQRIEPA